MLDSTGAGDGGGNSLELLPHPHTTKIITFSQNAVSRVIKKSGNHSGFRSF